MRTMRIVPGIDAVQSHQMLAAKYSTPVNQPRHAAARMVGDSAATTSQGTNATQPRYHCPNGAAASVSSATDPIEAVAIRARDCVGCADSSFMMSIPRSHVYRCYLCAPLPKSIANAKFTTGVLLLRRKLDELSFARR